MLTWNMLLNNYLDLLMGYASLVTYLFAVRNEHAVRRKLKYLPLILPGTVLVMAATVVYYFWFSLPGLYIVLSAANVIVCVRWAMRVWRLSFWQAVSSTCMAGILQVATVTFMRIFELLLPGVPENAAAVYGMYGIAVLCSAAGAFLLYKLRFGEAFLLLTEDEKGQVKTALILIALVVTMEVFFRLQRGILPQYQMAYFGLLIVLVALIVVFVISLARRFDAGRQLKIWQDVIARQRVYEQDLEEIRREVRSFRHDYKNLLAGLSEQANEGEMEGVRATLAELDAGFDRRLGEKITRSTQIGNLQILPVRSLLLGRIAAMREKGIACRFEALYPVESVSMDIWDYIRCLGVLLDNAAEAAVKTEDPRVEIVLLAEEERLYLRVSNSWDEAADPARFFEEGFSTKGAGRGLGLSGYQRILTDYPNATASTEWGDGMFVQELTVSGGGKQR